MDGDTEANFFISYARREAGLMQANIRAPMDELGFVYWFDEQLSETLKSDSWWQEIVEQISATSVFVFLYTDQWQKSDICRRELDTAMSLRKEIIPVEIEQFDVQKEWLYISRRYQISKLYEKNGRRQFLTRLKAASAHDATRKQPAGAAAGSVNSLVRSLKKEAVEQASILKVLGSGSGFQLNEVFQKLKFETELCESDLSASDLVARRSPQRVLLLGIPGSGKTTLLQFLQLEFGKSGYPNLPLRQSARYLSSHGRGKLTEWVRDHLLGRTNGQIEIASGGTPVPGAHLVLMIDGLDEVSEAQYEELTGGINRLIEVYPDISVFLTSRFEGIKRSDFIDFEVLRIVGLTNRDIRSYVETTVPIVAREQVWNTIVGTPDLNEICRTPFILAMVCAAHAELGDRATQRATVYRRCVSYLLREADWQGGRSATSTQEVEQLRNALKFLALRFFKLDSAGSFRESEIIETIKLIPGFEQDSRLLLQKIIRRTGLLQADRDRYQFVHRSIWEYFVAEGCRDESYVSVVERANARHWEEPIRLMAGLLGELEFEKFIRLLWPRNTGLALRTMTELATIPDALLEDLYRSCDHQEKIRIVQELRTSCNLAEDKRRKEKLLCDTISVVLKVERSAEFVFYFVDLLQSADFPRCSSLVEKILDFANLRTRIEKYLREPKFCLNFVRIEEGRFIMGSDRLYEGLQPDASERPAHEVELSTYEIADRLVTNALFYDAFPYAEDRRNVYSSRDSQPVNYVTWFEAKVFALWLGCDLPTDAEWEYAARVGGKDDATLSDPLQIPNYAWYGDNSSNCTHDVGTKQPNSFGLYDVAGNLREWCQDWFDPTYYERCYAEGVIKESYRPEGG